MRKLYLHIGHPKTGTSFLQACFANSIASLNQAGVDYPDEKQDDAAMWQVSSGNGRMLMKRRPEYFELTQDKVFFSAEKLFQHFTRDPKIEDRLTSFCKHHDIQSIEVLLFIRDPITHAESSYQQAVKRSGKSDSADEHFRSFDRPKRVLKALRMRFKEAPLNWHVYNYDRNRKDLISIVETFLDVPGGTLLRGEDRAVNRSMTLSELRLLRALNQKDPEAASLLSTALCNQAPDQRSEKAYPSHAVQQKLIDRLRPAMDKVNALIDPAQHYGTDLQKPAGDQTAYSFSPEQIEVIGATLGGRYADLIKKKKRREKRVKASNTTSRAVNAERRYVKQVKTPER